MKLGKDEIQKIVLGGILLVVLVYCYFGFLLGPLQDSHEATKKKTQEIAAKVNDAKAQIKRTKDLEAQAPQQQLVLKQLTATIPDGSPVAWFPTRVSEYFKQHGVDKVVTRLNTETPEKDLPGYRETSWGIEFPKADFVPLAEALAGFENDQPLVEISGLQIESLKDDVESQHVVLTVNNLVKQ